jgi:hypothetical protein
MGVSVTNSSKDWDDFWYNSEDITDLFDINQSRIVDDKVTCFIDDQQVDCQTWTKNEEVK